MAASFFLVMAVVFAWLLFKGYSTGKIMARGWGSEIRLYRRHSEPVWYWVTFSTYVVIVVICVFVGTQLALRG